MAKDWNSPEEIALDGGKTHLSHAELQIPLNWFKLSRRDLSQTYARNRGDVLVSKYFIPNTSSLNKAYQLGVLYLVGL